MQFLIRSSYLVLQVGMSHEVQGFTRSGTRIQSCRKEHLRLNGKQVSEWAIKLNASIILGFCFTCLSSTFSLEFLCSSVALIWAKCARPHCAVLKSDGRRVIEAPRLGSLARCGDDDLRNVTVQLHCILMFSPHLGGPSNNSSSLCVF